MRSSYFFDSACVSFPTLQSNEEFILALKVIHLGPIELDRFEHVAGFEIKNSVIEFLDFTRKPVAIPHDDRIVISLGVCRSPGYKHGEQGKAKRGFVLADRVHHSDQTFVLDT